MQQESKQVVIATRNAGKLKEFEGMFTTLGIQVKSLADYPDLSDVVEDKDTFAGNALKKAKEIALQLNTPVLADDSGLLVEALGGEPGVYSARYAGEPANDHANNAKLLRELDSRIKPFTIPSSTAGAANGSVEEPQAYSLASFVSALVLYDPADESFLVAEGTCSGYILAQPRGEQGFGYDPLFYMPTFGKTLAEMTLSEKNNVSHRANALKKLMDLLKMD
ncbi:MAG: non-canonical purine NTP pyrophosphatase [Gorillibacterium sp.]|nr:non-canonical purine NTP pyrophosphatase [Gorillibacterium sp.]